MCSPIFRRKRRFLKLVGYLSILPFFLPGFLFPVEQLFSNPETRFGFPFILLRVSLVPLYPLFLILVRAGRVFSGLRRSRRRVQGSRISRMDFRISEIDLVLRIYPQELFHNLYIISGSSFKGVSLKTEIKLSI